MGKSHELAHPKTADHKVKLPFQLVFADLMGSLTPEALGDYKYITKISDEHTKWTETYLLEVQARRSQLLSGVRPICGDSKRFPTKEVSSSARSSRATAFRRGYRSNTPAPTRRSKLACPSALEELLQLWSGACLQTADCQRVSWEY